MAGLLNGPGDSGELIGTRDPAGPRLIHERGESAVRSTLIAVVSTAVFLGVVGWIVVNSPGWPAVQRSFFNGQVFAESWPVIVRAFWINVQLFLIAEVLILALGLVLAVLRGIDLAVDQHEVVCLIS